MEQRQDDAGKKQPDWTRTALVAAASMLVGGIAVAVWNRRALSRLREEPAAGEPEPTSEEI